MYIVAQLTILVIAVFNWRRYPRPSLYLAIMASLEVMGTIMQTGLPLIVQQMGIDALLVHALSSLVRMAIHLAAMCFLVLAVYVGRREVQSPASNVSPQLGTPGMENADPSFLLDPKNPYSPPRQPR